MPNSRIALSLLAVSGAMLVLGLIFGGFPQGALAKDEFRQAFFEVYPGAVGTVIETVPSRENHCGVCHWKFDGPACSIHDPTRSGILRCRYSIYQ